MDETQKRGQPTDHPVGQRPATEVGAKKYDPVPYPDETTKKACEAINKWADELRKWGKTATDEINKHKLALGLPPTHVPDPPPPPFK